MHFLDLDNYGFVLVIWIEKLLGDLCFLAIKILEMIYLLLLTKLFCCKNVLLTWWIGFNNGQSSLKNVNGHIDNVSLTKKPIILQWLLVVEKLH